MGMPVKEAEKENKAKNRIKNEPIGKAGKEETTKVPNSQPIEYYPKHRINEKLIEGLVDNHRRMVEFLEAIPINLKSNMWESEDLIKKPINWDKPPKDEDGAWHTKIRLIEPRGEEFTKILQSIPTTRKLSERESPREIIDLDHFYDT
ncbi:hypothetical protein Tco_0838195 [Tanacetum coccineum]|uniref:Uncharacterized protein n=1 Tax=Tanacetum coccineum TaxID=301880 RepID=A0ABQ5AR48_9ASTR